MNILDKIQEAIHDFERLNGVRPASLRISKPAIAYIKKEAHARYPAFSTCEDTDSLFGLPINAVESRDASIDFISPFSGVPNMRLMLPITAYRPQPHAE